MILVRFWFGGRVTIKTFGIAALKSLKICLIIHFIITLCQSKHFAQSEGRRGGGGVGQPGDVIELRGEGGHVGGGAPGGGRALDGRGVEQAGGGAGLHHGRLVFITLHIIII